VLFNDESAGDDFTSAILARRVAARIDDRPQLLRPVRATSSAQRSLANSDEAVTVANAIGESNQPEQQAPAIGPAT
jgi:hypothetical protein